MDERIPEWLRPGVNESVIDGGRELLVLNSTCMKLLDEHMKKFDGKEYNAERNKQADIVYELEDDGVVLFIDDRWKKNKQIRRV